MAAANTANVSLTTLRPIESKSPEDVACAGRDKPARDVRRRTYATAGFGCREIDNAIRAATMQSAPAMKKAGR